MKNFIKTLTNIFASNPETFANNPNIFYYHDFEFVAPKEDGISTGGIYKRGDTTYMVKDMSAPWSIYEYVGSNIAAKILPGRSPEAFLVIDDEKVMVATKFLHNFKQAEIDPYKYFHNVPRKGEICLVAKFLMHGDEHLGNLGFIDDGINTQAAILDFSLSLEQPFSKTILYHNDKQDLQVNLIQENVKLFSTIAALDIESILEQLFTDLELAYTNECSSLAIVHSHKNRLKKELVSRVELVKKESFVSAYLYSILDGNSLVTKYLEPWILGADIHHYGKTLFKEAIYNLNIERFYKLLPVMATSLADIKSDFVTIMNQGSYKKSYKLFDAMFAYMKNDPNLMFEALKESRFDEKYIFDKLFPYIKNHSNFGELLSLSVHFSDRYFFDKIFPLSTLEDKENALTMIVKNYFHTDKVQEELFKTLLSYLSDSPNSMVKALEDCYNYSQHDLVGRVLPYVKDYESLSPELVDYLSTTYETLSS